MSYAEFIAEKDKKIFSKMLKEDLNMSNEVNENKELTDEGLENVTGGVKPDSKQMVICKRCGKQFPISKGKCPYCIPKVMLV